MNLLEIIVISISLAMDAFAVSICKGLSMKKLSIKNAMIIGAYFGFFQGLMPLIGFYLGSIFTGFLESITYIIATILLTIIGIGMIKESFAREEKQNDQVNFKTMIVLAIATSIDALVIGISFAFLKVNIYLSIIFIGFITFLLSFIGTIFGNKLGNKLGSKSNLLGGIVLIGMAIKILLENIL